MRVLVAVDGSRHSELVIEEAAARRWPEDTAIELLTVVHAAMPRLPDLAFSIAEGHDALEERHRQHVPDWLRAAAGRIRRGSPGITVTTRLLEGLPRETIVMEARAFRADLIMIGSRGYGPLLRALLGSVAQSVIRNAPCPVELVRAPKPGRLVLEAAS